MSAHNLHLSTSNRLKAETSQRREVPTTSRPYNESITPNLSRRIGHAEKSRTANSDVPILFSPLVISCYNSILKNNALVAALK